MNCDICDIPASKKSAGIVSIGSESTIYLYQCTKCHKTFTKKIEGNVLEHPSVLVSADNVHKPKSKSKQKRSKAK